MRFRKHGTGRTLAPHVTLRRIRIERRLVPGMNKSQLPDRIVTARAVVRKAVPEDLPALAAWPDYPAPYREFSLSMDKARSTDGPCWWERIDWPDRCHYSVVDPEGAGIVGVLALVRIDWSVPAAGNMGVRIHPDFCDRGYGSETLGALLEAALDAGMRSIRLDVSPVNPRAIRCYHKCGMRKVDEFWRTVHPPDDPNDPGWMKAKPYLRRKDDGWEAQFDWMEIRR